ncbi:GNAT family N-acetyltransferase [Pseudoalteromonas denitrificans]|uniref:Acetyltransferase (GNAT) family protein n=1 Tax=Pseudoalteromonas denitrificans DSM 6059 TaxID=1123010 RepID=A0A1I1NEX1_9GAMM|nr:GNAT family N-acetyltransferase [Pseudoalteromonas denitrificans]SFC92270.1 Acetyltransferase (GNAT) family protein [Pseudoalteromonas denitrificans DSM 6059]
MRDFQICLKRAKESDIPFLIKLRSQTMDAYLKKSAKPVDEQSHLMRIKYCFEHAKIVCDNNKPIGLLKYYLSQSKWHIVQIQISPEYQGFGLGKTLLTNIITAAQKNNQSVCLSVLKSNPAKNLYLRLGFKIKMISEYEMTMVYSHV